MDLKQKLLEHINDELNKYKSRQKRNGKRIFLCCPFHNERTPSLSMCLEDPVYWPGAFYCFGCKESGGWNAFAERTGLRKFKFDKKSLAENDPFRGLFGQLGHIEKQSQVKIELPKGLEPWQADFGKWRDLGPKYLAALGAFRWWAKEDSAYRILLPAYMAGELRGYVGGRLDGELEPKYRNSAGNWAKNSWLGYDYENNEATRRAWSKFQNKAVMLVEGPRDFARATRYGIPTLCVLGTNNYSQEKRNAVLALGVEYVVVCMDGDKAGRDAARQMVADFQPFVHVKNYQLPDETDPGDCDIKHFDKIKEFLDAKVNQ